jgi:8-oxo-dGTP pyrophosphatase MutT (NUDIX family)
MFKSTPNKIIKDDNGKIHWVSRSLVTIAFVTWRGKILIVKRGESVTETGKWCLPCGYVDYDETIEESIGREIWEETGIDVRNFIDLNSLKPVRIFSDPIGKKQNIHMDYIINLKDSDEPKIDMTIIDRLETTDVKWISFEEVGSYQFAFKHEEKIKNYY